MTPRPADPGVQRMWKELIKAKLREEFRHSIVTLTSAGCDEDDVFDAACRALNDLLVEMVKQGVGEGRRIDDRYWAGDEEDEAP